MVKKFKTELARISAKLPRLLIRNGNHHWPANVLETLETKYHLLPRDLRRLWYIRRKVLSGKVKTDSIFIYDRVKACDLNIPVKSYNDLNKYPDLLRYRGRISRSGEVRIEEIRNN